MDPLDDAQIELHEAERALDRAAGSLEAVSPDLARDVLRAKAQLQLVRWRMGMERVLDAAAA